MKKLDIPKNIGNGKVTSEVILGVLFVIYLIMGYPTPQPLAQMIHSNVGTFIIVILFLSLFLFCNPVLAILGLFVGFELIRRSEPQLGVIVTPPSLQPTTVPSLTSSHSLFDENKKQSFFTASNQFPTTLEEEVVKVMAPPQKLEARTYQDQYQPILDTIHDAEFL